MLSDQGQSSASEDRRMRLIQT